MQKCLPVQPNSYGNYPKVADSIKEQRFTLEVGVVDWSKIPDVGAVTLLACAFASVARHNHTPASKLWLTAWAMIAFHFVASMFIPVTGIGGTVALFFTLTSLTWAGVLFMCASVPYRQQKSSSIMLALLIAVNTLYVGIAVAGPAFDWALTPVAV